MLLSAICAAQAASTDATPFDTYVETDKPDLKLLEEKTVRLGRLLRSSSPATRISIIYYTDLGERNANFCSTKKLTAESRNDFARSILTKAGVKSSRIISIDGYLRPDTELHFWMVPPGAGLPKAV